MAKGNGGKSRKIGRTDRMGIKPGQCGSSYCTVCK